MNRRTFLQQSTALTATSLLTPPGIAGAKKSGSVNAHVWVYAAPMPGRDCFPVLDTVFADLAYAGMDGIELMPACLKHPDSVEKIKEYSGKSGVRVVGSSFSMPLWNKAKEAETLEEAELILSRLNQLQGRILGISVGDAGRKKTSAEFDTQAATLQEIRAIARKYGVVANLHNHTYEVADGLFDLSNTLQRVPDMPLGPDLDWLFQAKVDVPTFIEHFGSHIEYLHLRDHLWTGLWSEALGDGIVDWAKTANALKRANFKGDITVELAFTADFKPTRPIRDSFKQSRNLVRTQFGI